MKLPKIKFPKIRLYKPHLHVYLSLGFLYLETSLMRYLVDRRQYEYIGLRWKLFKWQGEFKLYRPGESR